MNKAILVGRLTKDPELKMTENTKREVCQFTIAVNRPYTNEDGERKADFINCVVWDKLAENLSKYQRKGNQVAEEPPVKPGPITTEQIDSMPTANDPFANFGNEVQINDSDLPF